MGGKKGKIRAKLIWILKALFTQLDENPNLNLSMANNNRSFQNITVLVQIASLNSDVKSRQRIQSNWIKCIIRWIDYMRVTQKHIIYQGTTSGASRGSEMMRVIAIKMVGPKIFAFLHIHYT